MKIIIHCLLITLSLCLSSGAAFAKTPKKHVSKSKIVKKNKKKVSKKKSNVGSTEPKVKSTTVSICTRELRVKNADFVQQSKNFTQAVIVAIETESEEACKITGQKRADQYTSQGWKCLGPSSVDKSENAYSCVQKSANFYIHYKENSLDHLLFTNLQKQHALIAYINPNSFEVCLDDKKDLEEGGVTDAVCHKEKK